MQWSEATRRPTERQLRLFAFLGGAICTFLALWQGWTGGISATAAMYACLAVVLAIVGAFRACWLRPIFIAWMVAVFPLAWLVSHVVLGLVYFGLIAPLGLLLRLSGRDALDLRPPSAQDGYWKEKPAAKDPSQYLRQY
jgi:hypothetical protein